MSRECAVECVFLPVHRRALRLEAKVAVHYYLVCEAQVGDTVVQLHQTG